jgi:hypothetical protein
MTTQPESNILSDLKVVEVASNKFFKNAREHLGRHKLLIEFLGSRRPDLGAEVAATLQKAINDASLPERLVIEQRYLALIDELRQAIDAARPAA